MPTSVLGTGQSELLEPQVAQKVGGLCQLVTPAATCPCLPLQKHRLRLVATDGAFSMDGDIAPLQEICQLASRYNALVFVDDCHGTGFLGATGRWAHVAPKALGWASKGGWERNQESSLQLTPRLLRAQAANSGRGSGGFPCRGTDELLGVKDQVTIINSTLGKALGGASGAYRVVPLGSPYPHAGP